MEKIAKWRTVYKIFLTLTIIGFVDGVLVPILLKDNPSGFIAVGLYLILGGVGAWIGTIFTQCWFVWGLVAIIVNRKANNLEKKLKMNSQQINEKN